MAFLSNQPLAPFHEMKEIAVHYRVFRLILTLLQNVMTSWTQLLLYPSSWATGENYMNAPYMVYSKDNCFHHAWDLWRALSLSPWESGQLSFIDHTPSVGLFVCIYDSVLLLLIISSSILSSSTHASSIFSFTASKHSTLCCSYLLHVQTYSVRWIWIRKGVETAACTNCSAYTST